MTDCPSNSINSAISILGVPTRGRVQLLHTCLAGYLECCRRHGRSAAMAVVDDSSSSEEGSANLDMLRSLSRPRGVEIAYAGLEQRQRYCAELARRASIPPDVVEFGFLNPENCARATGASRNTLLLQSVGELFLQVDDDTQCRVVPTPGDEMGLALSSRADPTEFWFTSQDEQVPSPSPAGDVDVFALHERLLGKRIRQCVREAGGGVDKRQATPELLSRIDHSEPAVAITATGVLGDSGMGSPAYLLTLQDESRVRLLSSEEAYQRGLRGQGLVRAVKRETLCESAFCMALNLGLDNRRLLPPFMPVERNQDGVFAALVRFCPTVGWYGFLPWAVLHQSPASGSSNPWKDVETIRLAQLVQLLLAEVAMHCGADDTGKRLVALGVGLQEFARQSVADFEQLVHASWRRQILGLANRLVERIREYDAQPDFWFVDVQRLLVGWQSRLDDVATAIPADLTANFGKAQAREMAPRLVSRFGQLLCAWPDLVAAAADLRKRGISPAAAVTPVST